MFWRKKISEEEAATIFALSIVDSMRDSWDTFQVTLQEVLEWQIEIDNLKIASEFMICIATVHLQSISNIFPREQALRLKQHALDRLQSQRLGPSINESFAEYQQAWDSKSGGDNPFAPMSAVIILFLKRIGYTKTISADNKTFNPGILMALGHIFTKSVKPNWKDIATDFKVIP